MITRVVDNIQTTKSVIGANVFVFDASQGMVPGNTYTFKLQAYNFYSTFFNLDVSCPWSPVATFFASDLPNFVPQLNFVNRTSTDATVYWSLFTSQ